MSAADKRSEAADLRKRAAAARSVGVSIKTLAPSVGQQLALTVSAHAASGALSERWKEALSIAEKTLRGKDDPQLEALRAILTEQAGGAAQLIDSKGAELLSMAERWEGKADGIDETLDDAAVPWPASTSRSRQPSKTQALPADKLKG